MWEVIVCELSRTLFLAKQICVMKYDPFEGYTPRLYHHTKPNDPLLEYPSHLLWEANPTPILISSNPEKALRYPTN